MSTLGRPTKFTNEIALRIIGLISEGVFLTDALRALADEGIEIGVQTVYNWELQDRQVITKDEDGVEVSELFSVAIAHARARGEEAILLSTIQIADDGTNDYVQKIKDSGEKEIVFDSEHVQRSKLRIETRLKALAKFNPGRWGDKIDITSKDQALSTGVIILPAKDQAPE